MQRDWDSQASKIGQRRLESIILYRDCIKLYIYHVFPWLFQPRGLGKLDLVDFPWSAPVQIGIPPRRDWDFPGVQNWSTTPRIDYKTSLWLIKRLVFFWGELTRITTDLYIYLSSSLHLCPSVSWHHLDIISYISISASLLFRAGKPPGLETGFWSRGVALEKKSIFL